MPTHATCNNTFSLDEEYFRQSFGVLSYQSETGKHLVDDIVRTIRRPDKKALALKILNEFDERPGGIILPYGKVAKKLDGKRIRRVIWKIVRGLFYHDKKIILPERTLCRIDIIPPSEKPPDIFGFVANQESQGSYGAIFDYKTMEHYIEEKRVTITTARHEPFLDYSVIINRDISIKNAVLALYRAVVLFTFGEFCSGIK